MEKKITALRQWAKGRARPTTTNPNLAMVNKNAIRGVEF